MQPVYLYSEDGGSLGLDLNEESPGCKTGISQWREVFLYAVEALLLATSLYEWHRSTASWVTLSKMNTREVSTHSPVQETSTGQHRTTSQKKGMCTEPPSRTSDFGNRPIILFPFSLFFLYKVFYRLTITYIMKRAVGSRGISPLSLKQ
jgi:hypothetical protein